MEETHDQANGQVKHLRVTLNSGKPWNMPADVAVALIESMAKANPDLVGAHLQHALMGVMPARRGRRPAGEA